MRKILKYLIDFQRQYFDLKLYLTIALWLVILFTFNYSLNFEDDYLNAWSYTPWKWIWMLFWQGIPFLTVCFILYLYRIKTTWLTSREFWIKFLIGFSILALDRSFYGYIYLREWLSGIDYIFVMKCVKWSSSLFVSVIPLLIMYQLVERDNPKIYYGLQVKRFDAKPYFILLGLTGILVGIGAFTFADLQEYYPRYHFARGTQFSQLHDLPEWISVFIYELTYGIDFISVELYFRGFMIYAFSRTLGGYAVLAMICSYAVLHFGKPMTEALSSVFGGYILGIISFNSRSIWGGIMIHMGIAWIMEFFGYLVRIL